MTTASMTLDGDVGPFRRKLQEAAQSLDKFGGDAVKAGDRASSGLAGVMSGAQSLQGILIGLSGALGVAALANFASGVINAADTLQDMSDRSGVAVESLVGLGHAAAFSGSSQEALGVSMRNLNKSISEAASGNAGLVQLFDDLGVSVTDAEGRTRKADDVFRDLADVLPRLSEADRVAVSMKLLGKSGEEMIPVLMMGRESLAAFEAEAARLNPGIADIARQSGEFNDVMDLLSLELRAGFLPVVKEMLPMITEVARALQGVAAQGTSSNFAVTALRTVFQTIAVVGANVAFVFKGVGNEIGGIAAQLGALMRGDFKAFSEIGRMMKEDAKIARAELDAFEQRIMNPQAAPASAPAAAGAGASGGANRIRLTPTGSAPASSQSSRATEEASMMQYYESILQQERLRASETDALREFSKTQELAFWTEMAGFYDIAAKDRVQIEKKISDLTIQTRRDAARTSLEIDAEGIRAREQIALGAVDGARMGAQLQLDLDQITRVQMLQRDQEFEAQRYAIQVQALTERLALMERDPNTSPVEMARIKNELLQLEQQHGIKLQQIRNQQTVAGNEGGMLGNIGGDMLGAFGQATQGLLAQTQTWASATMAIYRRIRDSFIQNMILEPAQKWLASKATMLAKEMGFISAETAAKTGASAVVATAKVAEATTAITANAASAASGGAAAVAPTPFIGPALAPGAFAAMLGLGLGALGLIASAEGGYDIPSGINPLTQLHEQEMVLPKGPSNLMRRLASMEESGQLGGGASGPSNTVNIYPRGRMTKTEARESARDIANALNELHGGGWRAGR